MICFNNDYNDINNDNIHLEKNNHESSWENIIIIVYIVIGILLLTCVFVTEAQTKEEGIEERRKLRRWERKRFRKECEQHIRKKKKGNISRKRKKEDSR